LFLHTDLTHLLETHSLKQPSGHPPSAVSEGQTFMYFPRRR